MGGKVNRYRRSRRNIGVSKKKCGIPKIGYIGIKTIIHRFHSSRIIASNSFMKRHSVRAACQALVVVGGGFGEA